MRTSGNINSTEKDETPKTRRKPGRVPTSCAECRRLKLRCDKNIPCEKCVSRGCGSICPDGSLTPGKGNRMVLANTEELHDRIESQSTRIRELEAALRTLQDSVSDQPHPILQKDVLQPITLHNINAAAAKKPVTDIPPSPRVPTPPEQPPGESHQPIEMDDDNLVNAFGTLTIGASSQSVLHGRTARPELQIRALGQQHRRKTPTPPRFLNLVDTLHFDFESCSLALAREAFNMLPSLSEAVRLCEIYHEYGKFMYTPVPRTELLDEVLNKIYRLDSFEALPCPALLALLFGVFALGTLFDSEKEPYSMESQEFYFLARAILQSDPNRPSRISIQAMIQVALYLDLSDWDSTGVHDTWVFIGHVVRLAQSAGLHLNGARWNLSETSVQRRSLLICQLFQLDSWASFHAGMQPTILSTDYPLPKEAEDANVDQGLPGSFQTWNWRYTALLHSVMINAFGPKQPTYMAVLSMDRQIRDFPVHPDWRPVCNAVATVELHVRRWMILSAKETTLLNLHRAYFVKALQEMPNELMRHRYIPSVMAVYRSAWRLGKSLSAAWTKAPNPLSRMSLPWSQGLSAGIVMCILVTRAPTSSLSQAALKELDDLLDLFKAAALLTRPAANLLEIIINLHQKAHNALEQSRRGVECFPSASELDRWAGKTHLLAELGTPESCTSGPSQLVTLTAAGAEYWSEAQADSMHPVLAHDMHCLNAGSPSYSEFFDLPTASAPQPILQQPPIHEVNDPGFYTPTGYPGYQLQTHQSPFLQNAPILDATWQSFAEQLGF